MRMERNFVPDVSDQGTSLSEELLYLAEGIAQLHRRIIQPEAVATPRILLSFFSLAV